MLKKGGVFSAAFLRGRSYNTPSFRHVCSAGDGVAPEVPGMAIAFECPVCEFQGKVADDQQGKETVCKGCGHKWTLNGSALADTSGASSVTTTATTTTTAPPSTKPATTDLIAAQCPACK